MIQAPHERVRVEMREGDSKSEWQTMEERERVRVRVREGHKNVR
jgi:hypothetical protein